MLTVRSLPVSTQEQREPLVRLEDRGTEDNVLLLVEDWTVLGLCLTAGVQVRGTLTVLTMDCAGQNYWTNVLIILTIQSFFSFDGCADTCVDGPRPQPRPSSLPTPRPQPVVFEEEEIESIVRPQVINTTRRPTTPRKTTARQTTRPTPPAPTTYRPSFKPPGITTGYSYETPDSGLQSLYGPPDTARRGRKGRRG